MHDNYKKANAAPRCQYVRLNDQPCTQPALKDNVFCRFHDLLDHPLPDARQIPFVEDATTLQVALMQVIRSLQCGLIDRRTAGTILYALQIAASNLKHFSEECGHPFVQPNARKQDQKDDGVPGPSLAEILLERLQQIEDQEATERAATVAAQSPAPARPSAAPAPQPPSAVIDKLEACAADLPIPRAKPKVSRHRPTGSFDHAVPLGCHTESNLRAKFSGDTIHETSTSILQGSHAL